MNDNACFRFTSHGLRKDRKELFDLYPLLVGVDLELEINRRNENRKREIITVSGIRQKRRVRFHACDITLALRAKGDFRGLCGDPRVTRNPHDRF